MNPRNLTLVEKVRRFLYFDDTVDGWCVWCHLWVFGRVMCFIEWFIDNHGPDDTHYQDGTVRHWQREEWGTVHEYQ
jgi:hypothetical protein